MDIVYGFLKIENGFLFLDKKGVLFLGEKRGIESFKVKEHNSIFDQISCRKIGENLVFNIYWTCSYKEAFTN